jgi:hypothetical protein
MLNLRFRLAADARQRVHQLTKLGVKPMTTWVYMQSEAHLWTVGYFDPHGAWHSDSDHDTKEGAAARVNYLNGGHDD